MWRFFYQLPIYADVQGKTWIEQNTDGFLSLLNAGPCADGAFYF